MDNRDLVKLNKKIRNASGARVVLTATNDGHKMQETQVAGLDGEALEGVERFQNYGFTSVPLGGTEGIAIPIGGDRSHMALVAVDDRGTRKGGLAAGEVAVYSETGDFIHLKAGNKMESKTKELLTDAETKAEIKSPEMSLKGAIAVEAYGGGATTFVLTGDMTIDGNLVVTGNVTVTGDVVAGGISLKNHTHPGDSGGTTGKPK
jgi:phage baseplate assembly protein V